MSASNTPIRPVKFNFDNVFGSKGGIAAPTQVRHRSAYSADEVEAIRKESFAAGRQSALADASHAQSTALSAIAHSASILIHQFDAHRQALAGQSAGLALAVGRKLAEAALAAAPQAGLDAFIAQCLQRLHGEPRLVIRSAPDVADYVRANIEGLVQSNGYAGRVVVIAEPGMSLNGCRVEWEDGGIEQDLDAAFAAINEHVARWQESTSREGNAS